MSQGMFYTLGLQTGGFINPLAAAQGAVGAFRGSLTSMMAKASLVAGPLLGVASAAGLMHKAITSAADMESTSVAFKTLIGDAELAKKTLGELEALGAATPFEFPELADAGRKLIAFGESAGTVTQALSRIGDVASGVQAPIGEIAEIYGKARVQGQLFAEDINQLTGRGIPVISQFAKILNVTESEVKGLASEGKITFPLLEQAFINLTSTGGQFFGMMQEQSGTMNGLWSTLQDSIGKVLRTIGQPVNDAIRPMLKDGIELSTRFGNGLAAMIDILASARSQGNFGEMLSASLVLGGKQLTNVMFSGAQGVTAYLSTALPIAGMIFSNTITSPRIQAFFESLFGGVANLLRSQLEAGAATFLEGIGRAGAAADVRAASAQSDQRAGIYFGAAKANLSTADVAGEMVAIARQLRYADFKGNEAANNAKSTPFFDLTEDKAKFNALAQAANPEALKRFTAALNGTEVKTAGDQGAAKIKTSADGLAKALADAKGNIQKPVAEIPGAFKDQAEGETKRRRGLLDSEASWRARMDRRSAADAKKRLPESSMDDAEHEAWKRRQAQRRSRPIKQMAEAVNNAGNQAVGGMNRQPAPVGRDALLAPLESIHAALMGIDGRLSILEAV